MVSMTFKPQKSRSSQVPDDLQTTKVSPGSEEGGSPTSGTFTPLVSAEALGLHALCCYIKLIFPGRYNMLVELIPRLLEDKINSNVADRGKSRNRNVPV